MINIENAKKEFLKYVENYDSNNSNINRKIYHSFRVMECSKYIAESLNLTNEQIDLATLIGLLHDIARFEQYRIYNSFSDNNIDHGDFSIEILEKENLLRKFIKDEKYDYIIKTAIKNHNKFKIQDNLDEECLMYSKIIRDADKLDILYEGVHIFWETEEEKSQIEKGVISDKYFDSIKTHKSVLRNGKIEFLIDNVVFLLTLVFDINFNCSFKYILENNFIDDILDKFNYENDKTKNQILEVKKHVNDYINQNI